MAAQEGKLSLAVFLGPSTKDAASLLAGALGIAAAAWLDAAPGSAEREAATMTHALKDTLRRLDGEPLVPYMGRVARHLLAGELERHARYTERQGAAVHVALARVLAAVARAEVGDLVLGRVDPGGVQLLTTNMAPDEDANRLSAIEDVVEQQLREVVPSARLEDGGPLGVCIHAGEVGLERVAVRYVVEAAEAS